MLHLVAAVTASVHVFVVPSQVELLLDKLELTASTQAAGRATSLPLRRRRQLPRGVCTFQHNTCLSEVPKPATKAVSPQTHFPTPHKDFAAPPSTLLQLALTRSRETKKNQRSTQPHWQPPPDRPAPPLLHRSGWWHLSLLSPIAMQVGWLLFCNMNVLSACRSAAEIDLRKATARPKIGTFGNCSGRRRALAPCSPIPHAFSSHFP